MLPYVYCTWCTIIRPLASKAGPIVHEWWSSLSCIIPLISLPCQKSPKFSHLGWYSSFATIQTFIHIDIWVRFVCWAQKANCTSFKIGKLIVVMILLQFSGIPCPRLFLSQEKVCCHPDDWIEWWKGESAIFVKERPPFRNRISLSKLVHRKNAYCCNGPKPWFVRAPKLLSTGHKA